MEFDKIFVQKDLPSEMPEFKVPESEKKNNTIWIVKLLVLAGMAKTNGEARRLIEGGGVYIDGNKVENPDAEIPCNSSFIIKVGKRRFAKILP